MKASHPPGSGGSRAELLEYMRDQVQDHIDNPREDLTTYFLNAEMNGQRLDEGYVGGTIALLLLAGIDGASSAGRASGRPSKTANGMIRRDMGRSLPVGPGPSWQPRCWRSARSHSRLSRRSPSL